jgi:hypothetical protein
MFTNTSSLSPLSVSFNKIVYKVKEDGMARACSTNGENTNAYMILVG